ncbi:hypothetical protein IQ227_07265 [Anabaena aphanizomenioides LEGE 00250]|uniref:Uncharacterized protein n=1 Tax=Sphaerospermopsis aphanizomenoides LEGE 00250 TaxID=2777972 RepID=A0ABR9VBI6_9CYAN|nr:hypothetical protein [Sphaerospermopsis aphanizomenoides]MBE9235840.1 hypothetical protein [Sphaerospermopsis aphanizomenoides LEGE 00250]
MELVIGAIGILVSLLGVMTKILFEVQGSIKQEAIKETRLEDKIILINYRIDDLEKKIDTMQKK